MYVWYGRPEDRFMYIFWENLCISFCHRIHFLRKQFTPQNHTKSVLIILLSSQCWRLSAQSLHTSVYNNAVQVRHRCSSHHIDVDCCCHRSKMSSGTKRHEHLWKHILQVRWQQDLLRRWHHLPTDVYLRCIDVLLVNLIVYRSCIWVLIIMTEGLSGVRMSRWGFLSCSRISSSSNKCWD